MPNFAIPCQALVYTSSYMSSRSTRSSSSSPHLLGGCGGSRTMAPTNIARIVNAWLYLIPEDLRSSSDSAKDSGYEQYVKNAECQVAHAFRSCEGFRWPREATFPERSDTSSSDSRPEADSSKYCTWDHRTYLTQLSY